MNVPYSWLKEFVPSLPPLEEVADLLPQLGLGVERVFTLPAPPAGVVVARVTGVTPLDGSDHLTMCKVDDGSSTYTVVCGAPNVRAPMLSALAKPGTHLPAADLNVETREVMGVTSEGMLCSPKELGLYDYAGGIIVFGADVQPGQSLSELWPEEAVLELEITPNRADAFSVLGVARDLAAKLGVAYRHPAANLTLGDETVDDGLTVKIDDPAACPCFTLQRVDGVTVAPSPVWLQRRLAALGLRPRNNVVDVTNYVTFELGQPSHAYDLDTLHEHKVVVRRARAGERLELLNEETVDLSEDDLVIATPEDDNTKPVGLAGVMGGLHDSINATTTNVALEAAHFEPVGVRKAAKRHGLSTDAHTRFERGVDPNLPPAASARAAHLIAELGRGTVHPGTTVVGGEAELEPVAFRPSRVAFLTTLQVPLDEQQRYLEALGCTVEILAEDDWRVAPPSWRFDLGIEEDLVEEVARLYGYEHIFETVPTMHFVPSETDATYRKLRLLLAGLGLQETMSYVFSSDAELARAAAPGAQVRLVNPQGVERSVLRTALYPSLLNAAVINRAAESLALFEIGRVFLAAEQEQERLGLLVRGPWAQGGWLPSQPTDFYVLKGLLDKLAATLGVTLQLESADHPHLHPGVSATVVWDGRDVGSAGRLHPEVAARYDLGEVYVAELGLPLVGAELAFRDVVRQPHAERDLAVVTPRATAYAELESLVVGAAGERLETVTPFDVYRGPPVPEDKQSVALRLQFRHPDRALRDAEVDAYMANVITALTDKGYAVRDR